MRLRLFSALEKIVDRVIGFYIPAYDNLPTIALEEITRAEFERYQKSYRPRLDPSLSRVQHTTATFTIPTARARLVFNRDWENRIHEGQVGYYYAKYKGYYPDLGLYAVEVNGSAAIEWGESLLIDPETSTVYVLASIGDGPSGAQLVSPGNTYLAYYDNQAVSSAETFIGLIRISGSPRRYREYASFRSAGHIVESLVWIDDYAFAVELRVGKSGNDFKYFKTKDLRSLGK
ncbi:MAG: hypothetical protein AB7I59_31230 [Geminicoccaceae bacterium]